MGMIRCLDKAGNEIRLLDLTGLRLEDQEMLLDALRQEMEALPAERWDQPWGNGGSMDPAFVRWYRVLVEFDSPLLRDPRGLGLKDKYSIDTGHQVIVRDSPEQDSKVLLFIAPNRRSASSEPI